MTKLKCQIKPKIQKFKVLSVKGLLKNADAYCLYPTCSLVQHAASLAVKAASFHFAPFGFTALTALCSVPLKNRRLVKLILKYHCHLKAETTNTKVIFAEAKEYMGLRVAKFRRLWVIFCSCQSMNKSEKKMIFSTVC